jgi:hypothetical protein
MEIQNGAPKVTGPDDELEAMRAVAAALGAIDRESAQRVLRWAAERFGLDAPALERAYAPAGTAGSPPAPENTPDLATLSAEAAPETGPEKALVVGYFLQFVQGLQELDAQAINTELKNLGHPLSNVTATLSLLIKQSPSLMIQTRKLGRGQQARKKYKLTSAGQSRVRDLLQRGGAAAG